MPPQLNFDGQVNFVEHAVHQALSPAHAGGDLGDRVVLQAKLQNLAVLLARQSGEKPYRRRHVALLDTATGREVGRCEGAMGDLTTLCFSPDDRFLLTGGTDGMAHLWDPAKGEELCALVAFDDGNWAVFDHEGRYDSSQAGRFDGLHWVVGNEPVELARFKDRYYEPGLLAKKLGLSIEPLPKVGINQESSRPIK